MLVMCLAYSLPFCLRLFYARLGSSCKRVCCAFDSSMWTMTTARLLRILVRRAPPPHTHTHPPTHPPTHHQISTQRRPREHTDHCLKISLSAQRSSRLHGRQLALFMVRTGFCVVYVPHVVVTVCARSLFCRPWLRNVNRDNAAASLSPPQTPYLLPAPLAIWCTAGVLNTDNMAIGGYTLDYGPFGFVSALGSDGDYVPNLSDTDRRYSFARCVQAGSRMPPNPPALQLYLKILLALALSPASQHPQTLFLSNFLCVPHVTNRLMRVCYFCASKRLRATALMYYSLQKSEVCTAQKPSANSPCTQILYHRALLWGIGNLLWY